MIKKISKYLAPFFFLILLLAYSSLFLDPTQPLKFLLLSVFALLGNGILFINSKKLDHSFLKSPVTVFLALYSICCAFSLFYSSSFSNGVYELCKLLLYFNFFILTVYYLQNQTFKATVYPLSYSLSIFQLVTIVGVSTSFSAPAFEHIWLHSKTYAGLFHNPNLTSQLLLLTSVFPLYTVIYAQRRVLRILQAVVLAIGLSIVLVIGSKALYFALLLSVFAITFLQFWLKKVVSKKLLLIGLVVTILAGVFIAYKVYPNVSEILSFQHRIELWKRTGGMIEESPIRGKGLGSWHIENLNHVPPRSIENEKQYHSIYSPLGNIFYERPHNDFLWIWSEVGIAGVVLYLLLMVMALFFVSRLIVGHSGAERVHYFLLFIGILIYLVIAFFSFPKERIEHSLLLMLFFAFVVSKTLKVKKTGSSLGTSIVLSTILLISCGYSAFWGYERLAADFHMRNVVEAKRNESWQRVLRETKKIEREAYEFASNGTPVSWFKGTAQMQLGLQEEAHRSFLEAYKRHPTHIYTLNNLATTYFMQGRVDSAILFYQKTNRINPVYEDPIINLSVVYFNNGEHERAWESISRIPIHSQHPKYKQYANVILESKFKVMVNKVEESIDQSKLQAFLSNDPFIYFTIYVKSVKLKKSMAEVFSSELELFSVSAVPTE